MVFIWKNLAAFDTDPLHPIVSSNEGPKVTTPFYEPRVNFARRYMRKVQEDNDFEVRVLWTNEAGFSNSGLFTRNILNFHVWSTESTHGIQSVQNQEFSVIVISTEEIT